MDSYENGVKVEVGAESKKCLDKNSVLIYLSHFLSSFGDRIWHFAVGLYLYYLYPCSLLLTAVYGFSTCISLFLLGAPVGRWVDKSKRLKAARITILVQNACVVISATVMASAIYYKDEVKQFWGGRLEMMVYAVIIIIEIISELASMANKLVLEKDWIVVLARGDKRKLSTLNATMRTINLSCKILAPFVVGHLFDLLSYLYGAIFIATWNVISAVCEYYLLHVIFSLVPELATKRGSRALVTASATTSGQMNLKKCSAVAEINAVTPFGDNTDLVEISLREENDNEEEALLEGGTDTNNNSEKVPDFPLQNECLSPEYQSKNKVCRFCEGWTTYFTHHVKFAGLGLAFLYMTVLSFDNVTVGYLASQGVSAAVSGNMTAVSALVGILGSLSFPYFRKKFGKNIAGLLGFGMETTCLLFCVFSILAPGSPFVPNSISRIVEHSGTCRNKTGEPTLSIKEQWESHSNIFLLMAGVVSARYGLWIADLSVTQIFQEKVHESKRGVMGGLQNSLNQLMSLLKFSLTMVLPYPETFGYLILLSWAFVFSGWMLFGLFVCKDNRRRNRVSLELPIEPPNSQS